jgi:hypothetical protein
MLRLIAGSFCVALVLWVWSTVFYVISPIPYMTMSKTADDLAAGQALLEHFPETGTYILPGRYAATARSPPSISTAKAGPKRRWSKY